MKSPDRAYSKTILISAGFAAEIKVLTNSAVIVGEIEAHAWIRFMTLLKSPSLASYNASIVSGVI